MSCTPCPQHSALCWSDQWLHSVVSLPSLAALSASELRGMFWFLVGYATLAGGIKRTSVGRFIPQITLPNTFVGCLCGTNGYCQRYWFDLSPSPGECLYPHHSFLSAAVRHARAISRKPVPFPSAFWRRKTFWHEYKIMALWYPRHSAYVVHWVHGKLFGGHNFNVGFYFWWRFPLCWVGLFSDL